MNPNGPGSITNEIARRFEMYREQVIHGYLTEIEIIPEFSYSKGQNHCSDLLLASTNTIFAVAECRATKMTIQAKFSDRHLGEAKGATTGF